MDRRSPQQIVAIGAFSGVVTMVASVFLLYTFLPNPANQISLFDQIIWTIKFEIFALLPLLIGIITIGNERFLSDAIDPLLHKESRTMEVNARFVDNTLQQTVLFIPSLLAISTLITSDQMKIIPALVIVFIVARAVFWFGYHRNPLYRAPGMAATGYMIVGMLLYSAYQIIF